MASEAGDCRRSIESAALGANGRRIDLGVLVRIGLPCRRAAAGRAINLRSGAYALWGFCRAEQTSADTVRDLPHLARWLSGEALREFGSFPDRLDAADQNVKATPDAKASRPAVSLELAAWGGLYARSIGAARLAAQLAGEHRADPNAAYLLGLLHLAPEWPAVTNGPAAERGCDSFPSWLRDALAAVEAAGESDFSSVPGIVAAARSLVHAQPSKAQSSGVRSSSAKSNAKSSSATHRTGHESAPKFKFDRRALETEVDAARAAWLVPAEPGAYSISSTDLLACNRSKPSLPKLWSRRKSSHSKSWPTARATRSITRLRISRRRRKRCCNRSSIPTGGGCWQPSTRRRFGPTR